MKIIKWDFMRALLQTVCLAGIVLCGPHARAVPSGPQSQATQINVRGDQTCGNWVTARANRTESYVRVWLTGLFSGVALATGKDFWGTQGVNSLDSETVVVWFDKYCQANPATPLSVGARELFLERTRLRDQ